MIMVTTPNEHQNSKGNESEILTRKLEEIYNEKGMAGITDIFMKKFMQDIQGESDKETNENTTKKNKSSDSDELKAKGFSNNETEGKVEDIESKKELSEKNEDEEAVEDEEDEDFDAQAMVEELKSEFNKIKSEYEEICANAAEESANIAAKWIAVNHFIEGKFALLRFSDIFLDKLLGVAHPYALMYRPDGQDLLTDQEEDEDYEEDEEKKTPAYRFLTVGFPGEDSDKDVVSILNCHQLIDLAKEKNKTDENIEVIEMPKSISDPSKILKRINAAEGTYCIEGNCSDLCHWALTGKTTGFLTTGDFMDIEV